MYRLNGPRATWTGVECCVSKDESISWKIERLFTDLCPNGVASLDELTNQVATGNERERVIALSAVLDAALAELIAKRLVNKPKEVKDFLGADGDGRAPAGSFGARIQLALLIGLIDPDTAQALRAIKSIRNVYAHRIIVDSSHPEVLKHLEVLKVVMNDWVSSSLSRQDMSPRMRTVVKQSIHDEFERWFTPDTGGRMFLFLTTVRRLTGFLHVQSQIAIHIKSAHADYSAMVREMERMNKKEERRSRWRAKRAEKRRARP